MDRLALYSFIGMVIWHWIPVAKIVRYITGAHRDYQLCVFEGCPDWYNTFYTVETVKKRLNNKEPITMVWVTIWTKQYGFYRRICKPFRVTPNEDISMVAKISDAWKNQRIRWKS